MQEPLPIDEFGGDFVELRDAQSASFPDIGILVFECPFKRVTKILCDVFDSNTAHGSDCEGSEEGVSFIHGVLNSERNTFLKVLTPRMARSGWALA